MRAAISAAAAFSVAVGWAGTTTFPAMASAMVSLLVSRSIQPVANGLVRWVSGVAGASCQAMRARGRRRAAGQALRIGIVSLYNRFMRWIWISLLLALPLAAADVNTFSVVGYDPATGE